MLEVVRDAAGRVTSESAGLLNPTGINKWSKRAQTQHVLDCAVQTAIAKKPMCARTYGEAVAKALEDPTEPRNLALIQHALSIGVIERAALARPVDDLPEDAPLSSRQRIADIAESFDVGLTEGERTALQPAPGSNGGTG